MKQHSYLFIIFIFITLGKFSSFGQSIAEVVERVDSSVVMVITYDATGSADGQGSGVFVTNDGKILTNAHVIRDAYSAEVKSSIGTFNKVVILYKDESKDLALIQVATRNSVPPKFALDSELKTGQLVIAIGNPLGLEKTVSDGLISGIRRLKNGVELIQTTVPISPGSSGGVLLNEDGLLIGITTSTLLEGQNINFAISLNTIMWFIADFQKANSKGLSIEQLKLAREFVWYRGILPWVGNILSIIITTLVKVIFYVLIGGYILFGIIMGLLWLIDYLFPKAKEKRRAFYRKSVPKTPYVDILTNSILNRIRQSKIDKEIKPAQKNEIQSLTSVVPKKEDEVDENNIKSVENLYGAKVIPSEENLIPSIADDTPMSTIELMKGVEEFNTFYGITNNSTAKEVFHILRSIALNPETTPYEAVVALIYNFKILKYYADDPDDPEIYKKLKKSYKDGSLNSLVRPLIQKTKVADGKYAFGNETKIIDWDTLTTKLVQSRKINSLQELLEKIDKDGIEFTFRPEMNGKFNGILYHLMDDLFKQSINNNESFLPPVDLSANIFDAPQTKEDIIAEIEALDGDTYIQYLSKIDENPLPLSVANKLAYNLRKGNYGKRNGGQQYSIINAIVLRIQRDYLSEKGVIGYTGLDEFEIVIAEHLFSLDKDGWQKFLDVRSSKTELKKYLKELINSNPAYKDFRVKFLYLGFIRIMGNEFWNWQVPIIIPIATYDKFSREIKNFIESFLLFHYSYSTLLPDPEVFYAKKGRYSFPEDALGKYKTLLRNFIDGKYKYLSEIDAKNLLTFFEKFREMSEQSNSLIFSYTNVLISGLKQYLEIDTNSFIDEDNRSPHDHDNIFEDSYSNEELENDLFVFYCPKCGNKNQVSTSIPKDTISCIVCTKTITVPFD